MKRIEDTLNHYKEQIDHLEVPEEMEIRLQKALDQKRRKKKPFALVASILVVFLLLSYNFNAIAYYSQKLMGYDEVINGTLQDLNEKGKGQEINKSYTFNNGIKVTLDGIMVDANNLIAFYTIEAPKGIAENHMLTPTLYIDGLFQKYHAQGGQGKANDEYTKIKWVHEFEPPHFFEKNMSFNFHFIINGKPQEGKIDFTLDRMKAMGHTIKQTINKTYTFEDRNLKIHSIRATPTSTVIKASLEKLVDKAQDRVRDRDLHALYEINLLANGTEVDRLGSGSSSSGGDIELELRYDALPRDIEKLELKVVKLQNTQELSKKIELQVDMKSLTTDIMGQEMIIKNVYQDEGYTYITLVTEESVLLDDVFLKIDHVLSPLDEVIEKGYDKVIVKEENKAKITYERILKFKGTGKNLELQINKIVYPKTYNDIIEIPIK